VLVCGCGSSSKCIPAIGAQDNLVCINVERRGEERAELRNSASHLVAITIAAALVSA
jgi:hypothetical protein